MNGSKLLSWTQNHCCEPWQWNLLSIPGANWQNYDVISSGGRGILLECRRLLTRGGRGQKSRKFADVLNGWSPKKIYILNFKTTEPKSCHDASVWCIIYNDDVRSNEKIKWHANNIGTKLRLLCQLTRSTLLCSFFCIQDIQISIAFKLINLHMYVCLLDLGVLPI